MPRNDIPPPPTKPELRAHSKAVSEKLEKASIALNESKEAFVEASKNAVALGIALARMEDEVFYFQDELADAEAEAFARGALSEEAEIETAADKADARKAYGR